MAFDGIYLYSLIQELKSSMINLKIDKINQPEKDEILLTLRGKEQKKLLISASSNYPRIHFTKQVKENPKQAPMFCMVMRKYLIGGKILDIYQKDTDRVLCMDVECRDELGFNSIYSLIIEIMGRHSNITLVRTRDNKVMESIKHITFDMNTYRTLYPGVIYVFPPESTKVNPLNIQSDLISKALENSAISMNEMFFSKIFTGIGKPLSKELFVRYKENFSDSLDKNNIIDFISTTLETMLSNKKHIIYLDNNSYKDFTFTDLITFEQYDKLEFNSHSELLDAYYVNKDKQDRLNSKAQDIQKLINTNIDRCKKKIKILENTLVECESKDEYKLKGELLTSYIYSISPGERSVSLLNYYSEKEEYLTIELKENKSPSENVQEYFKKYNKLKKSEENALTQLENAKDELDYLSSVLSNLNNSDNYNDIEDIKNELIETGYIKFRKNKSKKSKPSEPMHFISSDGLDIYVGKNNIQNDFLTLKFAGKNDLWLHAKNMPGSHVIVKASEVPDKTLEEAAALAAYYSKGQNSSKVPIDYTQVKNVKKPNGAKPGMVIYYTNKTIYSEPKETNLKRVK
jgi:predicted ribosome quality control (RQC) complex YloA/Tae2 family protein